MAVCIGSKTIIRAGDSVIIRYGDTEIKAVHFFEGDGEWERDDSEGDIYYWLAALSKGIEYATDDPSEGIDLSFFIVKIEAEGIPFETLPQKVRVEKEGLGEKLEVVVTTLFGAGDNKPGCFAFLDSSPNHSGRPLSEIAGDGVA